MTNPTMASQWDPGNFKPLDMSKILGYPRQMPPRYDNWLPRFISNDGVRAEDHMDNLWVFFQLHPISDDVEDLAMKLFSSTLHDDARVWYDSLPDARITSTDQIEEVFLKRWSVRAYVLIAKWTQWHKKYWEWDLWWVPYQIWEIVTINPWNISP